MEKLVLIWEIGESALIQSLRFVSNLPFEWVVAALVFPVVASVISRNVFCFLSVLVLSTICYVSLYKPEHLFGILGVVSFLGSFLVTLASHFLRRKSRNTTMELSLLRDQVRELRQAEARRSMMELRSAKNVTEEFALALEESKKNA